MALLSRRCGESVETALAAAAFTVATAAGRAMSSDSESAMACKWSEPVVKLGPNFCANSPPQGLRYCADFVSQAEEASLLNTLDQGTWLGHLKGRPQQYFGLVYYQTTEDFAALQPACNLLQTGRPMSDFPAWLMPRVIDTGVFACLEEVNQVAANEYTGTTGISPHVEDPTSFGPNLATLSLNAPVELTLIPADMPPRKDGVDHGNWLKILLEPRSFLVLQGESRYAYRHGIRRSRMVDVRGGTSIRRDATYRRVSLTFRELLESRRKLLQGHEAEVAPATNDADDS